MWRSWRSVGLRTRGRTARANRLRPALEGLEDRQLPSGLASTLDPTDAAADLATADDVGAPADSAANASGGGISALSGPRTAATAQPSLVSLDFTNSLGTIYKNTTKGDYTFDPDSDPAYPKVEWQAGKANAPALLKAGASQYARARVVLDVGSIPDGTPYCLQGTAHLASGKALPALSFEQSGKLKVVNGKATVELTADDPLGPAIRKIAATIQWQLILHPGARTQKTFDLKTTGQHRIYTVFNAPRDTSLDQDKVTDNRIERATQFTAAAIKATGETTPKPPLIVFELQNSITFNVLNTLYWEAQNDPSAYWKVGDYKKPSQGIDCISISSFVSYVVAMEGIPGKVQVEPLTVLDRTKPLTAVIGSLGSAEGAVTNPKDPSERLFLWGGTGQAARHNNYEATLVYNYGGKAYYYPPGTGKVFDDPDAVLFVFDSLGWGKLGSDGVWHLAQVLFSYDDYPDKPQSILKQLY